MYSHTFFVTSVRAFFFDALLMLVLPMRRFSAVIFFNVALVSVVFFVVVAVGLAVTVVFVVVVIAIEG